MIGKLTVPRMNANDTWLELTSWLAADGEMVEEGAEVCEFATSKATVVFESPGRGFLKILKQSGARLKPGELFGVLVEEKSELARLDSAAEGPADVSEPIFTRKALETMRELDLAEELFRGSTYVVEADVLRKAGRSVEKRSLAKESEIQALRRGNESVLRSSLTVIADAQACLRLAQKEQSSLQAAVVFHLAKALQQPDLFESSPAFNYAMDMGGGIKPVLIRDYAAWTVKEWHERILEWGMKIVRGRMTPDELALGRLTVTDLSAQGIAFFEPLLVGDQSAILGVGGQLRGAAPQLSLTMAFDHRIYSGRDIALFLARLSAAIEAP